MRPITVLEYETDTVEISPRGRRSRDRLQCPRLEVTGPKTDRSSLRLYVIGGKADYRSPRLEVTGTQTDYSNPLSEEPITTAIIRVWR